MWEHIDYWSKTTWFPKVDFQSRFPLKSHTH